MPFSAENLWEQLSLEGAVHEQNWNTASELRVPSGHEINKPTVLFKKVQDEDIGEEREKLQRLSKKT